MKITLKDGTIKEYGQAMSVYDIALDISEGLARNACAGEIDGKVVDLRTLVDRDCVLNILTFSDDAGKAANKGKKIEIWLCLLSRTKNHSAARYCRNF